MATLSVGLVILMASCQKPNPDADELLGEDLDVQVMATAFSVLDDANVAAKDGALHFTDTSTFFADVEKILKLDDEEFAKLEKTVGFKSLQSVLHEAYEAFDGLSTEAELRAWQERYKDVVELRDSVVTPLVSQRVYQRLSNRSGEYFLGDAYNKVTPERVVTILDGKKDKLARGLQLADSDAESGILLTLLNEPQQIESENSSVSPMAGCPGGQHLAAMREHDKRKVFLTFDIVPFRGLYTFITTVEVRAYGHKKGLFGWNKYKTKYRIENLYFQLYDAWGNLQTSDDNLTHTTTGGDQYELLFRAGMPDETGFHDYVTPTHFTGAKARATSRGTVPYWAVYCCSSPSACPSVYGDYQF